MSSRPDNNPIEHSGRIIRAETRTKATPEQAYEAWADPQKIAQWFTDKAEGKAEPGATMTWIFQRFNYRIPYEVLIAQPDEKFAIRWNPPHGMSPGILEVTISKEGGDTVIRLVNSGFREGAEWNEEFEGVRSGWQMALPILKHYLDHYYGMPRGTFLATRPAEFSFEDVVPFHRSEHGLRQWLTISGGYGEVGEPFVLQLQEGGPVTGRVLARSERETTLSWDEIRGVLEVKAFSMGTQRILCVRGCGWGLGQDIAKQIERQMERAVGRLAGALKVSSACA